MLKWWILSYTYFTTIKDISFWENKNCWVSTVWQEFISLFIGEETEAQEGIDEFLWPQKGQG